MISAIHAAIAISAMLRGMTMFGRTLGGQWRDMWQVIVIDDLQNRPWSSIWLTHAQPPGFSLWGVFWYKLLHGKFIVGMQWGYIALGTMTCVLIYSLTKTLSKSRRAALVVGFMVALNPAMFYFEAYMLYETLIVAMVTLSAWMLERGIRSGRLRWLIALIVLLNLLVLTRSFYHLIFIPAALVFAWPLWRKLRPTVILALLLAAVMLPAGWYAKNEVQYGFFGSSSWFGMGLFRCVVKGYTQQEIQRLADEGVVSQMVAQRWPYDHFPRDYVKFGYNKTSTIPVLSRDDFHNINVPDISRQYQVDSMTLIRLHPCRYLGSIHRAYTEFCEPVTRFSHLDYHRVKYIKWEVPYSCLLYGMWVTDVIYTFTNVELGSMFYFYFPMMLVGGAAWAAARARKNRAALAAGRPVEPADAAAPWVMAYVIFLSVYVVLVGTMFEFGENVRFRFGLEPLHFALAVILVRSAWLRWGPSCAQSPRADRSACHKLPVQ
ncbi:phospholipid carrier-dependent glycosyltransferase [bacterium]|nr:phospholipid carrier-dependent glycosyltransferase [bacterium]